MKIYCNNSTEYYLNLISLAGEIPFGKREAAMPYVKRNIDEARATLIKDKKIKTNKAEDGISSARLRGAAGERAVGEVSPVLLEHAKKMCVYNTPKSETVKRRFRGEFISFLINEGIAVDGIQLIKHSNILGRNESPCQIQALSETESLLSELAEVFKAKEPVYITNKVLTSLTQQTPSLVETNVKNQSTRSGLLCTRNRAYRVFCPPTKGFRYSSKVEMETIGRERALLNSLESPMGRTGFHEIFILPEIKECIDLCLNEKRIKNIIGGKIFIVPYCEMLGSYIKLIQVDDWENKLEAVLNETSYAKRYNIFSALSCNIYEIRNWEYRRGVFNPVFIIHPWQEKLVKQLYGYKITNPEEQIQYITPQIFEQMVDYIERM